MALHHTHGTHDHDDPSAQAATRPLARTVLLVTVAVAVAAAALIAVRLWPTSDDTAPDASVTARYAAPGVTFPRATVTSVQPACPPSQSTSSTTSDPTCGKAVVVLDGTGSATRTLTLDIPSEVLQAGLRPGDRIVVLKLPDDLQAQAAAQGGKLSSPYSFAGIERGGPIWVAVALFAIAVVAVGRWRGLGSLLGLAFSGVVLLKYVAPALLVGKNPVLVSVAAAVLIMLVVLYLTHGTSLRTTTALVGTIAGIVITAAAGTWAVDVTRLTGVSDDDGGTLQALAGSVDLHALVTAGVIIGGLGALNDVTITQTSAVWELAAVGPDLPRRSVFGAAMRIGRDHLASTVYTIVFAYAGASMPVLLLLAAFDRPWADVLTSEDIATEVIRTVASAFGLVLAIPITTAIAVVTVVGPRPRRADGGRHRAGSAT